MGRYSNIDLSRYANGYQPSATVNDALRKKQEAENAVTNYGNFSYSNQAAYDSVLNDILNREDFSYDINADPLYQQYKNQYTALGKLAMEDTIGQASSMTGGYGNSYAVSAGSQAYQSYVNQINDKIPELWSLARSAYESDRAADYDKYGMLSADRQTQYGEWTDGLNRLLNERGYYADNYNNAYSQDYTTWSDNRNYDQAQYWNEYNAGYQAERDAIADEQFRAQLQQDQNQFNEQMAFNREELAAKTLAAQAEASTPDSAEISKFNNGLLTNKEFYAAERRTVGSRGNSGNGGYLIDGVPYNDYNSYVTAQLRDAYNTGAISEATLNYLLDYYKVD